MNATQAYKEQPKQDFKYNTKQYSQEEAKNKLTIILFKTEIFFHKTGMLFIVTLDFGKTFNMDVKICVGRGHFYEVANICCTDGRQKLPQVLKHLYSLTERSVPSPRSLNPTLTTHSDLFRLNKSLFLRFQFVSFSNFYIYD